MTTYFHASLESHEPGGLISTAGADNYDWIRRARDGENAANEALDAACPTGTLFRRTCTFAAVEGGFALAFAMREHGVNVRLYEVVPAENTPFHLGPMFLTTALQQRLQALSTEPEPANAARLKHQVEAIVTSYWSEVEGWTGIEVLAREFRVVGEVVLKATDREAAAANARNRYQEDVQRVARRWPMPGPPVEPLTWPED